MTIYRYKKNGLLYTIVRCSPMKYTGVWYEAVPFNHHEAIRANGSNEFLVGMTLKDFEVVSEA